MAGFERNDTTANRLRVALDNSGKKQADLSRETGIDRGALSHYLKGRYEPKLDAISKLAKSLNVSEMWLWGYDVPMERYSEQKEKPTANDGLSKNRRALMEFCETVPEEKVEKVLRLMQAILEADS